MKKTSIPWTALISGIYTEKFLDGSMVTGINHFLDVSNIIDVALDFSNSNFMHNFVNFLCSKDFELSES